MYLSEYEAFVSNPVWKEIVSTIKEVIVGLEDDLKELDPITQGSIMARQQGRLKMAEFLLALPDDIKREMLETNNKTKEESKDDDGE